MGTDPTMTAIRRAAPSDAATLLPLYAAFFAEDGVAFDALRHAETLAAMLADDRAALWVAGDDGTARGLVSATLSRGVEFGLSAEIEDLYVVPPLRGRGLARRLFETALAWAEARGAVEIGLVVTPEAEADQGLTRFYRRFGFEDSRRILMLRNRRAT